MAYNTAPFHGRLARTYKNGTAIDFTDGWSIDTTLDMADTSRQGQAWHEGIAGQAGWSGQLSGHLVMGNTEQIALVNNLITAAPGTKLTDMEFMLDSSANGLYGNIFITGFSVSAPVGDKVGFTATFQGDGALTASSSIS